jgi:DNA-binding transcriptional LysR family regulator
MLEPGIAETSTFVAVLEQKSFTKAAKQLGLSPPRVSEMVRALEARLGVRLVERTTRSVAATAAGERLLERLRPVLADYHAALESTDDFRSRPAGTLRLTVAPPVADFFLPPLIPQFLARYPEINLDISTDTNYVDIVAARYDAGIRPGERISRDMIAVRISDELPIVKAGAPAYLAQHGTPRTPQELTAHSCISFRLASGALFPWRFRMRRRAFELQVESRLIVNEPRMMIKAALDGVGLIQAPLIYVASELAAGRLVTILDDWAPQPIDGFFLYYPSRRHIRPALKVLVDFLREARRGLPVKPPPSSAEPS